MIQLLFVCHGNICRSPMAQYIFAQRAAARGIACVTDSAATSREEIGNPVYPPARQKLAQHGIGCKGKTARQLTAEDYGYYDLLIGMEEANLRNMRRICGGDPERKMHLMLEGTTHPGDVADPWYTGDFDTAWRDIEDGCRALLAWLTQK